MEYKITGHFPLEKVLVDTGFVPELDKLFFDFGNCRLTASKGIKYFDEIFMFNGYYRTERRAGELKFELPLHVESFEQGVALIAYCLRKADLLMKPDWLERGIELQDTLPWRKAIKAFKDKPNAYLEEEWFRLMVKKLRILAQDPESGLLMVSFDGEIVKIKSQNILLVAPARGIPWNEEVLIDSNDLLILPKRLSKTGGDMYLWEGRLIIGNRSIPVTTPQPDFNERSE